MDSTPNGNNKNSMIEKKMFLRLLKELSPEINLVNALSNCRTKIGTNICIIPYTIDQIPYCSDPIYLDISGRVSSASP